MTDPKLSHCNQHISVVRVTHVAFVNQKNPHKSNGKHSLLKIFGYDQALCYRQAKIIKNQSEFCWVVFIETTVKTLMGISTVTDVTFRVIFETLI